jgi:AcrR family transcriptional regulator
MDSYGPARTRCPRTMPRIMHDYRDEVRKKVVDAAYTFFLRKGYHATTMSEIAASLGVTKTALYQYFPGKEDLYAAVAEHGREQLAGILDRSYREGNLLDGSAALFDSLVLYLPRFSAMNAELMLLATNNERIREHLSRDRAEDLRVIERFIRGQQKRGLVSATLDSRLLAVACDALINGLLNDVMMGMDKDEAKKTWLTAVAQLIRTNE